MLPSSFQGQEYDSGSAQSKEAKVDEVQGDILEKQQEELENSETEDGERPSCSTYTSETVAGSMSFSLKRTNPASCLTAVSKRPACDMDQADPAHNPDVMVISSPPCGAIDSCSEAFGPVEAETSCTGQTLMCVQISEPPSGRLFEGEAACSVFGIDASVMRTVDSQPQQSELSWPGMQPTDIFPYSSQSHPHQESSRQNQESGATQSQQQEPFSRYTCTFCPRRFNQQCKLRIHEATKVPELFKTPEPDQNFVHVTSCSSVRGSAHDRAPQQLQSSAAPICLRGTRQTDQAMMADCVGFQAQIASIIEILANSAVAEICKLVEDGYAALRSQMDQERQKSEKEKDVLRQKLREMDAKMRSYERKMRRRNQREEMHAVHFRPPEDSDEHQPLAPSLPTSTEDKSLHHMSKEETKALPLVKQERVERDDCNLDLKVEVNIRAECGLSAALESSEEFPASDALLDTSVTSSTTQPSTAPTDTTVDLTCRPRARRKAAKSHCNSLIVGNGATEAGRRDIGGSLSDGVLKPELQTDDTTEDELNPSQLSASVASDEPSPDRLNSLGLDLAWMQERVSHLGAAYAVAQLGLGNTETGHPSASFPTQGGGDSLDGPPTMLFTSGAHEMAAFAASFDMAAAAAAAAAVVTAPPPPPPPPPPPAAPSATTTSQRRPYRSSTANAKEPVVCAVCGRVFPSAGAMELHQRVHTGERPYTCPHCGKGFAQPNNLRVHLLIHTGERRYRCSLCGKSFISSSHLKRHRTVHTQEKPYSCSRCGQSFSQMCSVRRHRQQSQCGL
ncbi:uncharacterized protein V6R79_015243 [Siganus canaliculatus]